MQAFLSDIRLSGDTDFAKKFNEVSDLFHKAFRTDGLSEAESEAAAQAYYDAKLKLELGG